MIGLKRNVAKVIEKEVVKEVEKIVYPPKQNPSFELKYFVLNGLQTAAINMLEVTDLGIVAGEMFPPEFNNEQYLHINLQDGSALGMPEAIVFYTTMEGLELNGIKLPVYYGQPYVGESIEKDTIKNNGLLVYDLWRVYHYYKQFMISVEKTPNNPIFQYLQEGHQYSVLNQRINISLSGEQKYFDYFNNKEMSALI